MNEALKILESNELLRHIILFKLYVEGNGGTMKKVKIQDSVKDLYADNFNIEAYRNSCNYLFDSGYVDRNTSYLTHSGILYFENWIKSFNSLTENDLETLNKELPKKFFDFFKFTSNTTTVLSFVTQILKLSDRFK